MDALLYQPGVLAHFRDDDQTLPAALYQFAGQSLLAWHLDALADAGIDRVVIALPLLASAYESELTSAIARGLDIVLLPAVPESVDNGALLGAALPLLEGENILMLRADTWSGYDLSRLPPVPRDAAHLVLTDNDSAHPGGDLVLLPGGRLSRGAGLKLTYTGIGLFTRPLLTQIASTKAEAHAPGVSLFDEIALSLAPALAAGKIHGEYHAGPWTSIRHPDHLADIDGAITTD